MDGAASSENEKATMAIAAGCQSRFRRHAHENCFGGIGKGLTSTRSSFHTFPFLSSSITAASHMFSPSAIFAIASKFALILLAGSGAAAASSSTTSNSHAFNVEIIGGDNPRIDGGESASLNLASAAVLSETDPSVEWWLWGTGGGSDDGGGSGLWERCASHAACAECSSSWGCHWCGSDGVCYAEGSVHGCAVGTSCDADNNGSDDSCSSRADCASCAATSWGCHWCAYDKSCHAKGSTHGCAVGASCDADGDNDNKGSDDSCSSRADCALCAASSWGCHWCAYDNSCHAKGSIHGCAAGVDCYAIDRCQRLEPEQIDDGMFSESFYRGAGTVAKVAVGIFAGLVVCCATACLASATAVKCAVDDLIPVPLEEERWSYERIRDQDQYAGGSWNEPDELEFALLPPSTNVNPDDESKKSPEDTGKEDDQENESGEEQSEGSGEGRILTEIRTDDEMMEYAGDAVSSMHDSQSCSWSYDSRTHHQRAPPPPPPPRRAKNVHRMYCACQICYLVTLVITALLSVVSLSYAPRKPEYNVCTDQLAWKSIVEGMTSLKMSASFDLLVSVLNPNRVQVDLTSGSGELYNDGKYVGSFNLPPAKISPRAISDIVVKVTFTPDKWAALSLTAEYYKGTLVFDISGHSNVLVPALGNYSFDTKFEDIKVNVNDPALDDTHLCACPGW